MNISKKEILKKHKRIGKRFIPPLVQLGLTEVSYINSILPEILWMGLINDRLGYNNGIKIITKLACSTKEIHDSNKFNNFSICSSYNNLTENEKNKIIELLKKESCYDAIQSCLLPLTILYKKFPLSFLGVPVEVNEKTILLEQIKHCLKKHINKHEQPSLVIQATAVYIRATTGGLKIASGLDIPNLEAIITTPESEEAKKAAGFVRSTIMMESMPPWSDNNYTWARSFWNQGLTVDSCDQ